MPKVYIASDHAGFELKHLLIPYIKQLGYEVEDVGDATPTPEDDYPDFIIPCAERVASDKGAFGIVIGKSGQGEAMAANRVKGARAAVYYGGSVDIPALARHHNDANILSLGAGFLKAEEAHDAVRSFLQTPFSNDERHVRRLAEF
jgi:ribose 5-phosphate isomerase B